ncbi:MAG: adenylate cyclase [Gammaproteobacteria bacterium]
MNSKSVKSRRLAVILHADVVESTLLVRKNEMLAHESMQSTFQCLAEKITAYNGVAHEIRGDALVAEFSRPSDALLAACAFQEDQANNNRTVETVSDVEVRIGIALGEVVIADDTITGLGVILAQRLEQIADPGGVVVQGSVSEAVPERLPFDFTPLGERSLKGISQPVKCFRVAVIQGESLPLPESVSDDLQTSRARTKQDSIKSRPSIAVLPFNNMSGDTDQEYFSDGITEDIITELSRFNELFVIARNSSFVFKGQSVDIAEVGDRLGVQYILEGSVRKSGNRVRITAQLIDVANSNHIWADRYDRELEDIFAVQDEVVLMITATLMGKVGQAYRDRISQKSTSDMVAYDWFVKGRELFYTSTSDDNQQAIEMFTNAISQDAGYATANALLGESYVREWVTYWNSSLKISSERAWKFSRQSLLLEDNNCNAHTAIGMAYLYIQHDHNQAGIHLRRATELNPASTHAIIGLSRYESFIGNPQRAIALLNEARHSNPFWRYDWSLIVAYVVSQEFDAARNLIQSVQSPAPQMLMSMAVIYAQTGDLKMARKCSTEYMKAASSKLGEEKIERWTEFVLNRFPLKEQKDIDVYLDGLTKAGFSE